jgi:hypothetical protein
LNNTSKLAQALTSEFITNNLKRNFNKASKELKAAVYNAILNQIENDKCVVLSDPSKLNSMR